MTQLDKRIRKEERGKEGRNNKKEMDKIKSRKW